MDETKITGISGTRGNESPESLSPITFWVRGPDGMERDMLTITHDAFYIRGMKINGGQGEAEKVLRAFMEWFHLSVRSPPTSSAPAQPAAPPAEV